MTILALLSLIAWLVYGPALLVGVLYGVRKGNRIWREEGGAQVGRRIDGPCEDPSSFSQE